MTTINESDTENDYFYISDSETGDENNNHIPSHHQDNITSHRIQHNTLHQKTTTTIEFPQTTRETRLNRRNALQQKSLQHMLTEHTLRKHNKIQHDINQLWSLRFLNAHSLRGPSRMQAVVDYIKVFLPTIMGISETGLSGTEEHSLSSNLPHYVAISSSQMNNIIEQILDW